MGQGENIFLKSNKISWYHRRLGKGSRNIKNILMQDLKKNQHQQETMRQTDQYFPQSPQREEERRSSALILTDQECSEAGEACVAESTVIPHTLKDATNSNTRKRGTELRT